MIVAKRITATYRGNVEMRRARSRTKSWSIRKIIYCCALCTGIMAAVIAVQNQHLVQNEYELWALKKEWLATVKQNEQLKLEVAQLKSPLRIQQIAAAKMGMVVPATVYQVGVKADGQDARVADAFDTAKNTH